LELKVNRDRQNLDQQLNRAKKAEKKKKDKLSKIIKEYTKAYTAYSALHKQLHSAMSNANNIAKLKPYISKISSPLIAKDNIKKVKTYNEGVVVYNKIYNAYKMLKNDKNVWQKTIKQYNAGRL
jgi:flagellar capping protein FliD